MLWSTWLINQITKSIKKSESDTKQKVFEGFWPKKRHNKPTNYKPKKTGKYFDYKNEKDKKSSIKKYLEKSRQHLCNMKDNFKKFNEYKIHLTMNSKTSDAHRISLNLTDKIDLWRGDDHVTLLSRNPYYTWKNIKSCTESINLKYQEQYRIRVWTDWWILFNITHSRLLEHIVKKYETHNHKPLFQIYVNKIQHRVTFKIKSWALDTWKYGANWEYWRENDQE